jgi:hypothetical protein
VTLAYTLTTALVWPIGEQVVAHEMPVGTLSRYDVPGESDEVVTAATLSGVSWVQLVTNDGDVRNAGISAAVTAR